MQISTPHTEDKLHCTNPRAQSVTVPTIEWAAIIKEAKGKTTILQAKMITHSHERIVDKVKHLLKMLMKFMCTYLWGFSGPGIIILVLGLSKKYFNLHLGSRE